MSSSPLTVLCHGCYNPSSYPLPISCPSCHSIQYCSSDCALENQELHTKSTCHFLKRWCRIKNSRVIIQIGVDDLPFPQYERISGEKEEGRFPPPFEEMGTSIVVERNAFVKIVCMPHEIDACGSLLVQVVQSPPQQVENVSKEENKEEIYILCDVEALKPPTFPSQHLFNTSSSLIQASKSTWLKGVQYWYNDCNYLLAIEYFEKSINMYQWNDHDENEKRAPESVDELYENWLLHSPILLCDSNGTEKQCLDIARQCHFLGVCLIDQNEFTRGKIWLLRGLIHYTSLFSQTEEEKEDLEESMSCFMELMLLYEEEAKEDKERIEIARAIAEWCIEKYDEKSKWRDEYQRPGFIYAPSSSLLEEDDDEWLYHFPSVYYARNDNGNSEKEDLPTHHYHPKWCETLGQNFHVIEEEFLDLFTSFKKNKKNGSAATKETTLSDNYDKTTSLQKAPNHWPQVGSGTHRSTGTHDGRVVNDDGDWREIVLFGSGSNPSNTTIAPKTKALIKKIIPNAISLADMGGGEVIFSVLAPHTTIAPHCASTNLRLTAHLGLYVPSTSRENEGGRPKCGIRIRNTWHTWSKGKMLVFDDSYEHEVVNNTDECRAVLLIRFWHPLLFPSTESLRRDQHLVQQQQQRNAIQKAVKLRELEEMNRYNPPLPHYDYDSKNEGGRKWKIVEWRGRGWNVCSCCGQCGYQHVQLMTMNVLVIHDNDGEDGFSCKNVMFVCSCGQVIA